MPNIELLKRTHSSSKVLIYRREILKLEQSKLWQVFEHSAWNDKLLLHLP